MSIKIDMSQFEAQLKAELAKVQAETVQAIKREVGPLILASMASSASPTAGANGVAAVSSLLHFDDHATLLHLFGLNHAKLVFRRPNGTGSLVDGQPARVVRELLA